MEQFKLSVNLIVGQSNSRVSLIIEQSSVSGKSLTV